MANNESIDANLTKLTVTQLKDFLRKRSQPVSGNKSELISRAEGANKLGLVDLNVVREEDKKQQISRDQSKLTTPLSETLPHPRDLKNWTKDLNFVPDFSHNEIYNYLVLKMNSKKQMKSKVFYEDGHVHNIKVNNVNENSSHCYVKAKVLPSLPTANKKDSPDYDVWVMMSNVTGCVNSAECNCTAGEGESCNHIAALLYAISDIATKRKEGKLAPTSSKCKWNNPRKRKLSPKKAQEMKFQKYSFKGQPPSVKPIKMQDTGQCSVNTERFRQKLIQNHSSAGWLTNFPAGNGTGRPVPVLPVLHSISFQYSDVVDLKNHTCKDMFSKYFEQLKVTEKDCAVIECLTRQQSDCSKWKIAREERITASNFGKVVKQKVCTPPDSILKDLLGTVCMTLPFFVMKEITRRQLDGHTLPK